MKAINNEISEFNAEREKLIIKYANKDENGQVITNNGSAKISDENLKIFQNEINELISVEIEIPTNMIPLSWLEEIRLTPQEMIAIEPFVEE